MSDRVDETEDRGDLYTSPPVQRAARLLRHIAEGDRVLNMSRTARELGINRTTLLRLLHTLEAERFIELRPEGQAWRIGVGLIGLTAQAFFSEDLVQISVPVLTPYLSGLWLALVTPASFEVGRHLIEGLKNPTVVRDRSALDVFPIRPMGVGEAIRKAIASMTE